MGKRKSGWLKCAPSKSRAFVGGVEVKQLGSRVLAGGGSSRFSQLNQTSTGNLKARKRP